jgi:hypothetical protein
VRIVDLLIQMILAIDVITVLMPVWFATNVGNILQRTTISECVRSVLRNALKVGTTAKTLTKKTAGKP